MAKPNLKNCRIDFEPIAKRVDVPYNATLLEAAQQAGVILTSECGGERKCGRCRIKVLAGDVSPPSDKEKETFTKEELGEGMRLACSAHIRSDAKMIIPDTSLVTEQRLQLTGDSSGHILDPLVFAHQIDAPPPSLQDLRSDTERITSALEAVQNETNFRAEPAVIRQISPMARENQWRVTVYSREKEVIGIAPSLSPPLGMAVDLGTTKIAACIVDLGTGLELAIAGALNPQIGYGEDVMSRLSHALRNPDGASTLAGTVRETINNLLGKLVDKAGVDRGQVADMCIVGNTAMTHLFVDLPLRNLAASPYVAASNASMDIKAFALDLSAAPGAYVHILPCIGGFVGADHVAMIMAGGLDQAGHTVIGIDVGTNTEIVLANPGKNTLTSVSCASGPAFEGAHISDGMRAASGAIEGVSLTDSGCSLKTVGEAPAVGLCGSGIIDALAEFRRRDLINKGGRFNRDHGRVREGRHGPEFLLVPGDQSGSGRDVVITQEDINQVQLAKGAIRAGLDILLEATGTAPEEVQEVMIAGAFGSYLNVQSTLDIGLIPPLPNAEIHQVGNAALVGATRALLSKEERKRAQNIVAGTKYLELTTYPKFNRHFALGMMFPQFTQ